MPRPLRPASGLKYPARPCKAERPSRQAYVPMNIPSVTPSQIRNMLLLREEIALLDLRHEAAFATGHPLFAANMAAGRIAIEAEARLPRKDVPIVVYDAGEGLVAEAADRFAGFGYTNIRQLEGGLEGWRKAGFEIFIDVNSYAKAFGELVEFAPPYAVVVGGRSRRVDRRATRISGFSMSGGLTNMRP